MQISKKDNENLEFSTDTHTIVIEDIESEKEEQSNYSVDEEVLKEINKEPIKQEDTETINNEIENNAELDTSDNIEKTTKSTEKPTKPFYKKISFYVKVILLLGILIFNFNFCFTIVSGTSMNPTLTDGQILIATRHTSNINRFDIVVIKHDKLLIKRVIGLPGDTVMYDNNKLYINNEEINDEYGVGKTEDFYVKLKENEYFCLGDNRENSMDSRVYGAFTSDKLYAKIIKKGGIK